MTRCASFESHHSNNLSNLQVVLDRPPTNAPVRRVRLLVRTVLITTSYPQIPGDPAGHFVECEAVHLAQQGHEVHVIAPGSGAFAEEQGRPTACGTVAALGVGVGMPFGSLGGIARAKQ